MEALIGVIVGSAVSIAATLSAEVFKARRELRHRWDADALEAIANFVEAANLAIGALFDEGRSRGTPGSSEEATQRFDRASRAALDRVRVSHARARLLMSPIDDPLSSYVSALINLKVLADRGFVDGDAE
jgi:hypothetical protein